MKNQKNQRLLKKWKNLLEISPFYTCVTKTTIMWSPVPEIWSETEFFVILGYFLPFYTPPPLTDPKIKTSKKWKKKKNLQISFYKSVPKITIKCRTVPEIWCVTEVIIFTFWANFCPFILITAQITKLQKNVYHR